MMSSFDDQNQIPPFADGFSTERALSSRQTVTGLAAEVLLQVARRANAARRARDTAEIAAVSAALTTASEDEATAALQALDDPNRPHDWFLTERLGLIATEIGELCATDRITFAQASTGAARIYDYLRYRRRPLLAKPVETRAATFVLVPGDSHTAGMSATTDAFRTRGWDITLLVGYSHDELVARFEASTDQIFCFWAGSSQSLEALARIVVALTVSHPAAHVLVTGQIALEGDRIRAIPGIDACAPDSDAAYAWLESQTA